MKNKKNIHIIIDGGNNLTLKDILTIPIASIRLRAGLFFTKGFDNFNITFSNKLDNNKYDYLFISKLFDDYSSKSLYQKLLKFNKPVYIDFVDYNPNNKIFLEFYSKILKKNLLNVNFIVSSLKLKKKIQKFTKSNVYVLEDPLELPIQKNSKVINNQTYMWFGHYKNLIYLYRFLEKWKTQKNIKIIILTYVNINDIPTLLSEIKNLNVKSNFIFDIYKWSIPTLLKVLKEVRGVIIPGNIDDDRVNGCSNNRLISSFALGKPVAATVYESYKEYSKFFCNIDDNIEFKKFENDAIFYMKKTKIMQKKLNFYSSENLAKKLLKVMNI